MLNETISPAMRSHITAQLSFFTDFSKEIFNSAQRINELNLKIAQNLLEGSISNAQRLLSAKDPSELISIAASQAQPAAENARLYSQEISNIAAGTQAELVKTAEAHIPETSRTAAAVVDEVSKRASEATERATQLQKNTMDRINAGAARAAEAAGGGTQSRTAH